MRQEEEAVDPVETHRRSRPPPRPPSVAEDGIWLFFFLCVVAASMVLVPGDHGVEFLDRSVPPSCLFLRLTGHPCLGCGLTRSFVYMGHGQVGEAFRMHALGPILYAAVIHQVGIRAWWLVRRRWVRSEGLRSPL